MIHFVRSRGELSGALRLCSALYQNTALARAPGADGLTRRRSAAKEQTLVQPGRKRGELESRCALGRRSSLAGRGAENNREEERWKEQRRRTSCDWFSFGARQSHQKILFLYPSGTPTRHGNRRSSARRLEPVTRIRATFSLIGREQRNRSVTFEVLF